MKIIGIVLWLCALLLSAIQLADALARNAIIYGAVMVLAVLIYLPLLIYNWLWGDQRGHVIHFFAIFCAAWFMVLSFFRNAIPVEWMATGVLSGLAALGGLTWKCRPQIMADFKQGIRRNHFK